MTRSILARLIALGVVTLLGFYYILFDAVGIKIVNQPYTVHVDMPVAGGIYDDAYVTYRGVEIGKVSGLHLKRDGVVVDLSINHGVRIPVDVTANVRELTAAAEQYMDLVPPGNGDGTALDAAVGYMKPGYTIPAARTTVPVSVGELLDTVNTLVQSLHASDLNTLSKALAEGLGGVGADLHSIIVDGADLANSLEGAIPATQQLIDAGQNVLSTFNSTSNEFEQFSSNLNQLSQQVAQSNSDLIALLQNGSAAGSALTGFLSTNATPTESLINGLSGITSVAYQRQPAVQALFSVLPLFANDVAAVSAGKQLRFEITFNDANTVCPYTSSMLSPTTLVSAASLTGNCSISAPDLLQRGADKAPPPLPPTQG